MSTWCRGERPSATFAPYSTNVLPREPRACSIDTEGERTVVSTEVNRRALTVPLADHPPPSSWAQETAPSGSTFPSDHADEPLGRKSTPRRDRSWPPAAACHLAPTAVSDQPDCVPSVPAARSQSEACTRTSSEAPRPTRRTASGRSSTLHSPST